jgi:hypothetical protein
MRLLGPESAAVPWIALVSAVSVVIFGSIVVAARRQRSYATLPIALLAAAYAGVALASSVAGWMFSRTLHEMARTGGGIGAVSFGIWQATRVPLSAGWIAVAATAVALLLAVLTARDKMPPARPALVAWVAALAVAAGTIAVLLFRGSIAFVLAAITPGAQPAWLAGTSIADAIETRMLVGVAGSALCFLVVMALMIATIRHRSASRRVMLIVLVLSLGVSAGLVANLRSYSDRWRDVALNGRGVQGALPTPSAR